MEVTCDWLVMVPLTVGAVVPTGCVVVPPDLEGCVTVVDSPIGDPLSVELEGPAAAKGPDV